MRYPLTVVGLVKFLLAKRRRNKVLREESATVTGEEDVTIIRGSDLRTVRIVDAGDGSEARMPEFLAMLEARGLCFVKSAHWIRTPLMPKGWENFPFFLDLATPVFAMVKSLRDEGMDVVHAHEYVRDHHTLLQFDFVHKSTKGEKVYTRYLYAFADERARTLTLERASVFLDG